MPLTVLIVGGGIGGLATAIALRRADHRVTVLERKLQATEVGYAIEIPPNASRILTHLGLDLSSVRGCRQSGIDVFQAESEPMELIRKEERPSTDDAPFISVHRRDYHDALKDLALNPEGVGPPVELRFGCKVTSYDPATGAVALESGEVLESDLVVAADGNRSKAHQWVIGEEIPAKPTGLSNVRFVLPTTLLSEDSMLKKLVEKGVEGRQCIYSDSRGNVIMHYPCRDGTLQNFGVFHTEDETGHNTNKQTSNRESVAERVEKMNQTVSSLINHVKEEDLYLWQIVDRDPLPRFYKERLVVIGDANHPMEPKMGQGAAQAVEDGAVLGVLLQGVNALEELASRLEIWDTLRKPRAGAMQLMSRTSPITGGWIRSEDEEKARAFFPNGDLPANRSEMTVWAFEFDALAEARRAFSLEY